MVDEVGLPLDAAVGNIALLRGSSAGPVAAVEVGVKRGTGNGFAKVASTLCSRKPVKRSQKPGFSGLQTDTNGAPVENKVFASSHLVFLKFWR